MWCYCPNHDCDAPPMSQDAPVFAFPGDQCGWCGTIIEAMPEEAYEEAG